MKNIFFDNSKMNEVSYPSFIEDYDIGDTLNGRSTVSNGGGFYIGGGENAAEENAEGQADVFIKTNIFSLFTQYVYSIICKISNKIHNTKKTKIHDSVDDLPAVDTNNQVNVDDLPSVNINHQFTNDDHVYDAEKLVNLKIKSGKVCEKNIDEQSYVIIQDIKNYKKLNHLQLDLLKSFTKKELFDILILFNETYENLKELLKSDKSRE